MDFRPTLALTLAALLVAAACSALGVWQLFRAEEKSALAEMLRARVHAGPQSIDSLDFSDIDAIRYSNVRVTGRFDYARQFQIPHRRYHSQSGLHIITPFIVEPHGKRILVNRGWTPAGPLTDRDPAAATSTPETTLTGRLVLPARPPLRLGPANSDATPWHRSWLFADPELFAAASGREVYPLVLLMSPDETGRLKRDWKLPRPDPAMHYGYAVQWFAFAVIALAVWGVLSRNRRPKE